MSEFTAEFAGLTGVEVAGVRVADHDINAETSPAEPVRLAVDFDAFCRHDYQSILGLAMALTGHRAVAEELVQDALLAAHRQWDRISVYDDPSAWLRRVVVNRAISHRRRLTAEVKAITRLRPRRDVAQEIPERSAELWAAVRRLPTRQAQVIALTYLDDLDLPRVAQVLGISEGTAKTHLQRGRAALARALQLPDSSPELREGLR